jgi:hypothetical protein
MFDVKKSFLGVLRTAMALAIVAGTASVAIAATATWDRNPEPDVSGYKLSYGTAPGVYTVTIDVGNVTTYQFNPPPGNVYYVVVQAYNTAGELSEKSAEATIDLTSQAITNHLPTLSQPANQSSTLNASASLTLSAVDPNGTPIIFSASGLPPGLSIDSASGVIGGIASLKGTYQVTATASDGSLSVSRVFTWTIVEPVAPTPPPSASPTTDMAFDFGADGLWMNYVDSGWKKLHSMNPEEMTSGDVDGNGQSDLIVDFPGQGLWIWLNDSAWVQLDTWNSRAMVPVSRDGNGRSAILFDFPRSGLWLWRYGGDWVQLDSRDPRSMAAGDLDGNGRDEVVIDFEGSGVWVWADDQSWSLLHAQDVTSMTVGDLDGNGRRDVILDFPGAGLWVWSNNTSWWQLNTIGASLVMTGDLDGNGRDEAVLDFAGYGIWAWNDTAWSWLDVRDAEGLTSAKLDAGDRIEVVVDFGASGVWAWWNNSSWTQLHATSPEGSVAGRFKQR